MSDRVPAVPGDVGPFRSLVRTLDEGPHSELRGFFDPQRPLSIARAPGRLDVMGGIADYCGSLVLELPIAEATLAAAQEADDGRIVVASLSHERDGAVRITGLSCDDFRRLRDAGYEASREHFRRHPAEAWGAYIVGVVLVLAGESGLDVGGGLRVLVRSDVPEAKGVSSSAALEVAAMLAVSRLREMRLEGTEVARLCQLAENLVVGAPCGIMDQMTSAVGRQDHLLALLCQPAEVRGYVRLPESIAVWGIDSGIRHAVSGSDYGSVRTGAFMGYRILAELAGLPVEPAAHGLVECRDPQWLGYLANVGPDEFERRFAARLPETMRGDEFLAAYGGTTDRVTRVEPTRTYAVRQPTAHPIYEHARVSRFAELLGGALSDQVLVEMGDLMYGSHASYSACGLGSVGTDRLVEMVRQAGPRAGLFGAKITGGGSGGTVAVLGRAGADEAVAAIASRYGELAGRGGYVFTGSSPGACWLDDLGG
jgi:L-arabinokinase